MDSSKFIICRASAGSGKTFTLVKQYIELAFSAPENELNRRFTRILAITFTNKAANEMKERILSDLDKIAELGDQVPIGEKISQEMNMPSEKMKRYATIVRQAILHNYSDFAVCTIDSFVHRLVRTFAHDLGMPMNFDISLDQSELIENAVDDLMALTGTEGHQELTEILCEFAQSKMEDGKTFNTDADLKRLAEEIFKENSPEFMSQLADLSPERFRQISKEMRKANSEYEKKMKGYGEQALKAIADAGLTANDFHQKAKGAPGYFAKLAKGDFSLPGRYALDYLEGEKLGSKDKTAILADVKVTLRNIHQDIALFREKEEQNYNSRKMLSKNLYAIALLNKMNELVAEISHDNEVIHLSEFNKKINDVVQNEPSPFIYERIGNRYYNYLIDEFQDTSRLQWQNLVPLVENGVGSGHTSLVVGDGKQAIYRFRQGEVEQFVNLPKVDNPVHGRLLENGQTSVATRLEENRRTARTVVEFNNHFFSWAIANCYADNKGLQDIYIGQSDTTDLTQNPIKEGGYVQAGFWNLKDDKDRLAKEMLLDIRDLTENKGYQLKDITILARKRSTLGMISDFLTKNGISVISSESFLLTQSSVVLLLRNLLQYIMNPNDRTAAARVLIHLQRLGKIHNDYTEAFSQDLYEIDLDSLLAKEGFVIHTQQLRHLGLYDCCEEALRRLDLDNTETSYSATFLNVVAKYISSHRQDLGEFLEWFDNESDKLSSSTASDLNAVKLMTVHSSKGLESPIIMYATPMPKGNHESPIWVHINEESGIPLPAGYIAPKKDENTIFKEEFDEEFKKRDMDFINVLYVALTRPKEKLMLYCEAPGSAISESMLLKTYLSNCETTEVRPDVVALGENTPNPEVPKANNGKEKDETSSRPIEIQSISYPGWSERIAIAEQSAQIFGEVNTSAIDWGNTIHDLLANVRHSGDIDQAIDHYFNHASHSEEHRSEIHNALKKMMEQPEVAKFFNPDHTCKNECSLVRNGEVLRPDRIVFTPEETWVVDFKTGAPQTSYLHQVTQYCEAISEMGFPKVKGYLMFIGKEHTQVLPVD